jgi:hypothetical protein
MTWVCLLNGLVGRNKKSLMMRNIPRNRRKEKKKILIRAKN